MTERFLHDIKRTHHCNELSLKDKGASVCLMGWVHRRRDHGGLIFVDLRDREGITQIVLDPTTDKTAHAIADKVRSEYVLALQGTVMARPADMINSKLPTGEIEVRVKRVEILSEARTPPFPLDEHVETNETVRLRYRYMDLRRRELQQNMILRSTVCNLTRHFFFKKGFIEVETPILYKTTPEGARDFLVPSRIYPGHFYALPQSPQTLKQLLMVSGFDRYFQIVKCFRDEDLRADRQPEFTQLDLEMSFVSADDVRRTIEEYLRSLFKDVNGAVVPNPLPALSYKDAMEKYGSDKPDIRFGLELIPLSDLLANTTFKVFKEATVPGKRIDCLCLPPELAEQLSRKDLDGLPEMVKGSGAKGVAWVRLTDAGWQSPIAKYLSDDEKKAIEKRTNVKMGGLLLFLADKEKTVFDALGTLRLAFRDKFELVKNKPWGFVWVVDFPLLEFNEEDKRFYACHHPFTSPHRDDIELFMKSDSKDDLRRVRADAYDLAINGNEIFGGSVRIYRRDVQSRMFHVLGMNQEETTRQFGFFLEALEHGTPPHAGIAMGLDRMVMLMAGASSLRDVIAFPKTHKATCLMSEAPSPASQDQLKELHLRVREPV